MALFSWEEFTHGLNHDDLALLDPFRDAAMSLDASLNACTALKFSMCALPASSRVIDWRLRAGETDPYA